MNSYLGLISCLEFELEQVLKQEAFLPMNLAHLYEHITKIPIVAKAYKTSPCFTDYMGNIRENFKLKDSIDFTLFSICKERKQNFFNLYWDLKSNQIVLFTKPEDFKRKPCLPSKLFTIEDVRLTEIGGQFKPEYVPLDRPTLKNQSIIKDLINKIIYFYDEIPQEYRLAYLHINPDEWLIEGEVENFKDTIQYMYNFSTNLLDCWNLSGKFFHDDTDVVDGRATPGYLYYDVKNIKKIDKLTLRKTLSMISKYNY